MHPCTASMNAAAQLRRCGLENTGRACGTGHASVSITKRQKRRPWHTQSDTLLHVGPAPWCHAHPATRTMTTRQCACAEAGPCKRTPVTCQRDTSVTNEPMRSSSRSCEHSFLALIGFPSTGTLLRNSSSRPFKMQHPAATQGSSCQELCTLCPTCLPTTPCPLTNRNPVRVKSTEAFLTPWPSNHIPNEGGGIFSEAAIVKQASPIHSITAKM